MVASAALEGYNRGHGSHISLLPNWPPNSPDLNPIEHVWAYVQRRVNRRRCDTFADFQKAVLSELKAVPKEVIDALYGSMESRLEEVIARKGARTRY